MEGEEGPPRAAEPSIRPAMMARLNTVSDGEGSAAASSSLSSSPSPSFQERQQGKTKRPSQRHRPQQDRGNEEDADNDNVGALPVDHHTLSLSPSLEELGNGDIHTAPSNNLSQWTSNVFAHVMYHGVAAQNVSEFDIWALRFKDKALEAAYQQGRKEAIAKLMPHRFIVATALYFLFLVKDILTDDPESIHLAIILSRLFVWLFALSVTIGLNFKALWKYMKNHVDLCSWTLAFFMCVQLAVVTILRGLFYDVPLGGIFLIWAEAPLTMLPFWRVVPLQIAQIAVLFAATLVGPFNLQGCASVLAALLATFFASIIVGWELHSSARAQFLIKTRIRSEGGNVTDGQTYNDLGHMLVNGTRILQRVKDKADLEASTRSAAAGAGIARPARRALDTSSESASSVSIHNSKRVVPQALGQLGVGRSPAAIVAEKSVSERLAVLEMDPEAHQHPFAIPEEVAEDGPPALKKKNTLMPYDLTTSRTYYATSRELTKSAMDTSNAYELFGLTWTGAFTNKALDRGFWIYQQTMTRRKLVRIIFYFFIAESLFGVQDWVVCTPDDLKLMFLLRYGVKCSLLVLALSVLVSPYYKSWWSRRITTFAVITAVLASIVMNGIIRPPTYDHADQLIYLSILMRIMMHVSTSVSMNAMTATVTLISATVSMVLVDVFYRKLELTVILSDDIYVVAVMVVGIIFSRALERSARKEYLLVRALADQRKRNNARLNATLSSMHA